jgi:hypothetical protein
MFWKFIGRFVDSRDGRSTKSKTKPNVIPAEINRKEQDEVCVYGVH